MRRSASKSRVSHSAVLALAIVAVVAAAASAVDLQLAPSPACDVLPTVSEQLSCRLLEWGVSTGVLSEQQSQALATQSTALRTALHARNADTAKQNAAATDAVVRPGAGAQELSAGSVVWQWVARLRAAFSVMNVLYGVGGIIVVLAASFLMTLAYQIFGGFGLLLFGGLYASAFAMAGRSLVAAADYHLAGALLFTLSELMTPLWAFGLLLMLKANASAGTTSRLVTSATMAVGTACLLYARHWLPTIPLGVSWIVFSESTINEWYRNSRETTRCNLRALSGVLMGAAVYCLNRVVVPSNPLPGEALAVLHLLSTGQAWVGLTFREPTGRFGMYAYAVINCALLYAAPHTTWVLALWGGFGLVAFSVATAYRDLDGPMYNRRQDELDGYLAPLHVGRDALRLLRVLLFAAVLCAGLGTLPPLPSPVLQAFNALLRALHGVGLPITNAYVGGFGGLWLVAVSALAITIHTFRFVGVHLGLRGAAVLHPARWLPRELYTQWHVWVYIALYVALQSSWITADSAAGVSLSLGLFSINAGAALRWVLTGLCVAFAVAPVTALDLCNDSPSARQFLALFRSLLYFAQLRWGAPLLCAALFPGAAAPEQVVAWARNVLSAVAAGVYLSHTLAGLAWYRDRDNYGQKSNREAVLHFKGFAMEFAALVFAYEMKGDGDWLYFASLVIVTALNVAAQPAPLSWQLLYLLNNIALAVVSMVLACHCTLVVACAFIFRFLAQLAYRVFPRSLLYPLILSAQGLGIIYAGVQYQKHQDALHAFFQAYQTDRSLFILSSATLAYGLTVHVLSIVVSADRLAKRNPLLWLCGGRCRGPAPDVNLNGPAAFERLTYTGVQWGGPPVSGEPTEEPHGLWLSAAAFVQNQNDRTEPVVRQWLLDISRNGGRTGLVALQGHVVGNAFWRAVEADVGAMLVRPFKHAFLPLDMCQYLQPQDQGFVQREDGSLMVTFELGTGRNGTQRVSRKTLQNALQRLATQRGDPLLELVITWQLLDPTKQKDGVMLPCVAGRGNCHSGVLLRMRLRPSELLRADGENLDASARVYRPRVTAPAAAAGAGAGAGAGARAGKAGNKRANSARAVDATD